MKVPTHSAECCSTIPAARTACTATIITHRPARIYCSGSEEVAQVCKLVFFPQQPSGSTAIAINSVQTCLEPILKKRLVASSTDRKSSVLFFVSNTQIDLIDPGGIANFSFINTMLFSSNLSNLSHLYSLATSES